MEEVWKNSISIPIYEISNLGNVRHVLNKQIIKQEIFPNKYKFVRYNKKSYLVHRLVAECFVENDNVLKNIIVNHKDENRENNIYTNLEWCDKSYNEHYGSCIDKISKANSKCRIFKYDSNGNIVKTYNNARQINNISIQSCLSKNFNNRYFDGFYYFKEYEKFDINRRSHKYNISIIKDNIFVFSGNIKLAAKFLNYTYSNFKRIVSKYKNKDNFTINDYIIKIEMI